MNSYLEIKINNEVHSPENPKSEFIACCTDASLNPIQKDEINELNKKFRNESHEYPLIFIGMGTCGLASGADKVKKAIEAELTSKNLNAQIIPVGVLGNGQRK